MRQPKIDDFVRLSRDIPELSLVRGQVGVVRSRQPTLTSERPGVAYEVEFHCIGHDCQLHTLLQPEQIQLEEGSLRCEV